MKGLFIVNLFLRKALNKMQSIGKNLIYNITYQILIVIVPLITSPYLARTLGAEQIGVYSYTYSIVYYFMILAVLGINNYGNRSIAKVRDDKVKCDKTFCSIYALQLLLSVCVSAVYVLYCIFLVKDYSTVAWIQGLYILSNLLDVTWYFYGKENFKLTVFRNAVVKVLSLILILTFVKNSNDIWVYTLIMSGSMVLGQVIVWPQLFKEIHFVRPSFTEILAHLKPVFVLFIPVLAISVFSYMDKVMLGHISGMTETGYYENAEKIISIPKALIQAVGTVMLPRTANMVAYGLDDKIQDYIKTTMVGVLFISFASAFGIAGVSSVFAPVYWGADFTKCGLIISYMTPALIFSVFGNVIRTQYLIPKELDKEYTVSLVLGAITNFILNSILIPNLGAVGATIGTVGAEFVLCFYQVWTVRRNLQIKEYFKNGFQFLFAGILMFIVVKFIGNSLPTNIVTLCIQIIVGGFLYLLGNYFFYKKTRNTFIKNVGDRFVGKIVRVFRKDFT